jgi:hypothetical protein
VAGFSCGRFYFNFIITPYPKTRVMYAEVLGESFGLQEIMGVLIKMPINLLATLILMR